jgi:hypothetical protein
MPYENGTVILLSFGLTQDRQAQEDRLTGLQRGHLEFVGGCDDIGYHTPENAHFL